MTRIRSRRGVLSGVWVFAALLTAVACRYAPGPAPAASPDSVPAPAPAPKTAPQDGYVLHEERTVGVFTVQKWVSAASPDVSPAGMCECFTVVYQGDRKLATMGEAGVLAALTISEPSGQDFNRDGVPEFVASDWSGGAHCCYTTTVFSATEPPRKILEINTGNCGPGEFQDLDGDGTLELITCDDGWANEFCSFAESPLPPVVFSYDPARGEYVPATPRYATGLDKEIAGQLEDARKSASGAQGSGAGKCVALGPALMLMYAGRFDEGVRVLRELYRGPDAQQFEQATVAKVRRQPLWVAP